MTDLEQLQLDVASAAIAALRGVDCDLPEDELISAIVDALRRVAHGFGLEDGLAWGVAFDCVATQLLRDR